VPCSLDVRLPLVSRPSTASTDIRSLWVVKNSVWTNPEGFNDQSS